MQPPVDSWKSGETYDYFMGRWSRLVAQEFLDWLTLAEGKSWLDVGCGTGGLSHSIISTQQPNDVLGIDASEEFIRYAQTAYDDARLTFDVALAQAMPSQAQVFDATVSGLALNFMPQAEDAVAEMIRVTKPSGTIAAYVWDYAEGMQLLRFFWDAVATTDDTAASLDEAHRFPLCRKNALKDLFLDSGIANVAVKAIVVPTVFSSFDDYWQPFLGGDGPAPSYVSGLGSSQRRKLKEHLQERLPVAEDGTISLTARAWATKGTVTRTV